jgi:hypothetical protein
MFPPRTPFSRSRLAPRAAEIAACGEEKEAGNLPVSRSPSPASEAKTHVFASLAKFCQYFDGVGPRWPWYFEPMPPVP